MTREVIVGVDGSAPALAAVRWAAVEANERGLLLHLVHAIDPFDAAMASAPESFRHRGVVQELLDDAAAQAHEVCPDLTVITDVVPRTPVQALVSEDATGAMICIGSSGTKPPHPGHRASIATEVLVAARCPVTIVRSDPPIRGKVVAEITAECIAADVLHAAVAEAVMRNLPLRLVIGEADAASSLNGDELFARLGRDVNRYRARFHDLDIVTVSPSWGLRDYLRCYVSSIALFVAAPRQLHDIGTVLHPSASTALGMIDCPVMICGSEPARAATADVAGACGGTSEYTDPTSCRG
jgi:nucleotide-binding universal stress UspA family protein